MSTILARCTALGIVAGGFAITGDLGRLADRGMKVLSASDVPAAQAPEAQPTAEHLPAFSPLVPPARPQVAPPAIADGSPPAPAPPPAAGPAHDVAPVAQAIDLRPPAGGPDAIDVSKLQPGDRFVVWLTVARRPGSPAYRCLVFDMVDPAAAEALVYEAVSFTKDGQPKAAALPPRRVRIGDEKSGRSVARTSTMHVRHLGIAQRMANDGGETIGPIVALDVIR